MIESMPQEIEVRYIIPAIRREFAKILVTEKECSQKQAAKILDLTEAAVSQYFNLKRARDVVFSTEVVEEIRKSVNRLVEDSSKRVIIGELCRICNLTEVRQILCGIHRTQSKELENCNICFEREITL